MVSSKEVTVSGYLDSLPPDRKAAISAVRKTIKKNLPKGVVEIMDYGMIGYVIPLSRYPDTYNGHPFCLAGLAAQKSHNAVYLMNVYGDPATEKWFKAEYAKSGKKLDMGKSCVRFKKLEDLPLELIGKAIARADIDQMIARAESAKKKAVTARRRTKS